MIHMESQLSLCMKNEAMTKTVLAWCEAIDDFYMICYRYISNSVMVVNHIDELFSLAIAKHFWKNGWRGRNGAESCDKYSANKSKR